MHIRSVRNNPFIAHSITIDYSKLCSENEIFMYLGFCHFSGCSAVDVAIAIDASGSIRRENFYVVLNFTKTFVNNLNIDGNKYTQVRHVVISLY